MIALHTPCLAQTHRPRLLDAMLQIGDVLGWKQTAPKRQTCCGLPAWEAGYQNAARVAAQRTIHLFRDATTVLTPSASCLPMLTQHIPELLTDYPEAEAAQALAQKTRSWCCKVAEQSQTLLPHLQFSGRVMLLSACPTPPCTDFYQLLSAIPGLKMAEPAGDCPSFSHDLARRHPDISAGIAETFARPLYSSRVDVILINEPGCLMQLAPHFTKNRPRLLHPAEFLAAILR
ncbi:MAG: hypothetical protein DSY55_02760 [Clostridia bacterium]|nr:MAG: hypothetical protein DSY55_02760 [Clostridia bacterium]